MSNGLEEAKRAITEVCEALKTSPAIGRAVDDLRALLISKNEKYDNSVFEPCRIFTSASIETLIRVRLDDKVTRILRGDRDDEDPFDDFAGYLVLLRALPIFLEMMEARTVPGFVVTESLKNRGLRVGMTYQEVRDNKRTECEAKSFEHPAERIEGDPCSACKFLDGALCECGDSFVLHAPDGVCPEFYGSSFVLASWTPEPPDEERTTVPHDFDPSEGIRTQSNERNAFLAAESAQPKKETNVTDTNATTTTKKPRINRATWHDTVAGKVIIKLVLDALLDGEPQRSWYARDLAKSTGCALSELDLALDRLISTGAVVQHGKAKGTRYAVAGFTDWPTSTPRNRKSNEPPVSEADADAAHSLDASDSEET